MDFTYYAVYSNFVNLVFKLITVEGFHLLSCYPLIVTHIQQKNSSLLNHCLDIFLANSQLHLPKNATDFWGKNEEGYTNLWHFHQSHRDWR